MKKLKKLNQTGFAFFEIILIIIVVGIIAAVGVYLLKIDKKAATLDESARYAYPGYISQDLQTKINEHNTKKPSDTKVKYPPIPNVTYINPKGWVDSLVSSGTDSPYKSISIKSPDFKSSRDGECDEVKSGKEFNIFIQYINQNNEQFIKTKLSKDAYADGSFKNQTQTTLAGQKAVRLLVTPGECGYWVETTTAYKNYQISVSAFSDDNIKTAPYLVAPYSSIYNTFLSSVKFK